MRKIIGFVVNRPLPVLLFLLLVTTIMSIGLPKLQVEPSSEALMPKDSSEYRYNMRMKQVFGDSRLFMLTLIEPDGSALFSKESFALLNELVEEVEEFRVFNLDIEEKRLDTICSLASVTYTDSDSVQQVDSSEKEGGLSDEMIDSLLLGDTQLQNDYYDVFDLEAPLPTDIYVQPIRLRRDYQFDSYSPVTKAMLEQALDQAGFRQLQTVLSRTGLDDVGGTHSFSEEQYRAIVNEFETAFLLKSTEAVKLFMNPVSGEDIVGTKESLTPVDLIEEDEQGTRLLPQTDEEFTTYKQRLLGNPVFENTIYSTDEEGKIDSLAMTIQLQVIEDADAASRYLMDVITKYNEKELRFLPVGIPVFERYIQEYMARDMGLFLPLALLVVIMTFLLNFRMFRGVALPTLSVVLSIIWTMGLMGHIGIPVTMVVNILPTILVAVGSSYSIHLFNQFLHDRSELRGGAARQNLVRSMTRISTTVLLAALTTFIGFSTLSINQVVSLRHFGIFSAIGTVFACIISLLLIPSVFSLFPEKKTNRSDNMQNAHLRSIIEKGGRFATNHARGVVILSLFIAVIGIYGLTRINIESSPVTQFHDDSYVVTSDSHVSRKLDGTVTFNLMIDSGKAGGVKDPEFLKHIDETAKWIVSQKNRDNYNLLASYSFADVIKRMNKAMNAEDDAFYKLPTERSVVEDYIMLYSGEDRNSSGVPDTMERFVDPHYRVANITIKTGTYNGRPYSTKVLLESVSAINDYMNNHNFFEGMKHTVAGQGINYAVLNRLVARGQVVTISLTLIIIFGIIFFLFKDIKAALISLIPISFSIIFVYGTMGFLDIPLDLPKSIIAAITIGIGIDDTIHMLKTIRTRLLEGLPLRNAILASYGEAGMAIVYTSVALIFGFSVLMLSQFKVIFYFGWLVAMNMTATTIAALFILPAAAYLFNVSFGLSKESKTATVRSSNKVADMLTENTASERG
ncbi:MAG: MMPL family transporter [Spirochaetes bacterium]|jgi:predicted RND superfamily exporter protein|nr:MMPL family transporter [Spirochaetota bacterium]